MTLKLFVKLLTALLLFAFMAFWHLPSPEQVEKMMIEKGMIKRGAK